MRALVFEHYGQWFLHGAIELCTTTARNPEDPDQPPTSLPYSAWDPGSSSSNLLRKSCFTCEATASLAHNKGKKAYWQQRLRAESGQRRDKIWNMVSKQEMGQLNNFKSPQLPLVCISEAYASSTSLVVKFAS